MLSTEDARIGLEALRQTLRAGEPKGFEYAWPDGVADPACSQSLRWTDPFMGRAAVVMLARDVTRQRLTEASLRQAQKMKPSAIDRRHRP